MNLSSRLILPGLLVTFLGCAVETNATGATEDAISGDAPVAEEPVDANNPFDARACTQTYTAAEATARIAVDGPDRWSQSQDLLMRTRTCDENTGACSAWSKAKEVPGGYSMHPWRGYAATLRTVADQPHLILANYAFNQSKSCGAETDCGVLDGGEVRCELRAATLDYRTLTRRGGSEYTEFFCAEPQPLTLDTTAVVVTGHVSATCRRLIANWSSTAGGIRTERQVALP